MKIIFRLMFAIKNPAALVLSAFLVVVVMPDSGSIRADSPPATGKSESKPKSEEPVFKEIKGAIPSCDSCDGEMDRCVETKQPETLCKKNYEFCMNSCR